MNYFDKMPLAQIDQDAIDKGARELHPKALPAPRTGNSTLLQRP
jgi:hypothetical protein